MCNALLSKSSIARSSLDVYCRMLKPLANNVIISYRAYSLIDSAPDNRSSTYKCPLKIFAALGNANLSSSANF